MRRWLVVLVVVPLLAALVRADGAPTEEDEARRFHDNRALIKTLVDGSLRLAAEDDPLVRADCFAGLAECLADEMGHSAGLQDGARVEELGTHLDALLQGGLAPNLQLARARIPEGSADERKMHAVRDRAAAAAARVEARLQETGGEDGGAMQRTLRGVHQGRAEVEKAVKGPDKGAPPDGTGLEP
jgi:hypothetical protein